MADPRLFYGATARNRGPILEVLQSVLPARGTLLEIASGSGEHAAHMAPALPQWTWQPSDIDPKCLASIDAWREHAGVENLLPPLRLDVTEQPWPLTAAEVVFSANMIHIAPWQATLGLLEGAGALLSAQGLLLLYGPFSEGGVHTAQSNAAFDESLRERDPRWGVRDRDEVVAVAASHGLIHLRTIEMPANNRIVVLRRRPVAATAPDH